MGNLQQMGLGLLVPIIYGFGAYGLIEPTMVFFLLCVVAALLIAFSTILLRDKHSAVERCSQIKEKFEVYCQKVAILERQMVFYEKTICEQKERIRSLSKTIELQNDVIRKLGSGENPKKPQLRLIKSK
ncbi:MAG: hypothetical protein HRU19_01350 [Pseudobacteriovorax sp.]|nr:hypothetical protein [Pseudobacteriovorax sp.]